MMPRRRGESRGANCTPSISTRLVSLGVPPGGPGPSMRIAPGGAPWYQAYPPPRPGAWTPLAGCPDGRRAARVHQLAQRPACRGTLRPRRPRRRVGRPRVDRATRPGHDTRPDRSGDGTGDPPVLRAASRHRPLLRRSGIRQGVSHNARRGQALPRARRSTPGPRPRSAYRMGYPSARPRPGRSAVAAASPVTDRPAHSGRGHRSHVALSQVRLPASAPLGWRVRKPGLPRRRPHEREPRATSPTTTTPGSLASSRAGSPSPS